MPKPPPGKAALLEHISIMQRQEKFFRTLRMPAGGPPPAGAQPAPSEESGLTSALEEVRAKKLQQQQRCDAAAMAAIEELRAEQREAQQRLALQQAEQQRELQQQQLLQLQEQADEMRKEQLL